jgi:hypothetical protein
MADVTGAFEDLAAYDVFMHRGGGAQRTAHRPEGHDERPYS